MHTSTRTPSHLWHKLGALLLLSSLALFVALWVPRALAAGTTRYIDPAGSDIGNCTNSGVENPACHTVSYALSQSDVGDEIKLAPGTYTDTITFDRGVTVRGSGADVTVIQANAQPNIANTRVFTVAGGHAVTMTDLSIRHGVAEGVSDEGRGGAGWVAGQLTLIDSVIGPNKADNGGGLAVNNANGHLIVSNTAIVSNVANSRGGGVYLYDGEVEFRGGQVMYNASNGSSAGGGGIYVFGWSGLDTKMTQAGDTIIALNRASGNSSGGGIFINAGTANMNGASILSNTATSGTSGGGGVYVFGDNLGYEPAAFRMVNGLIQGNTSAGAGGGVSVDRTYAGAALTHTLVLSNQSAWGGGAYANSGQLSIASCLLLNNSATMTGGAVLLMGSGQLTVSNSCILDNSDLAAVRDSQETPTLVATGNWWGAANGPSGVYTGSGDSVGANVDFQPYRTAPAPICFQTASTTHLPVVLKN